MAACALCLLVLAVLSPAPILGLDPPPVPPEKPVYVFQYWARGEVPLRYITNRENCQKMNPDLTFVLFDAKNLSKWVDVPAAFDYVAPNFQSDIARGFLMNKYGGMYMDLDIICLHPLRAKFAKLRTWGGNYSIVNYIWPPEGHLAMGTSILGPMEPHNLWSKTFTRIIEVKLLKEFHDIKKWRESITDEVAGVYGSRPPFWPMHIELSWQILEAMWTVIKTVGEEAALREWYYFDGRDSWIYMPIYRAQPEVYSPTAHDKLIQDFFVIGAEIMPANGDFRHFSLLETGSTYESCKYVLCEIARRAARALDYVPRP